MFALTWYKLKWQKLHVFNQRERERVGENIECHFQKHPILFQQVLIRNNILHSCQRVWILCKQKHFHLVECRVIWKIVPLKFCLFLSQFPFCFGFPEWFVLFYHAVMDYLANFCSIWLSKKFSQDNPQCNQYGGWGSLIYRNHLRSVLILEQMISHLQTWHTGLYTFMLKIHSWILQYCLASQNIVSYCSCPILYQLSVKTHVFYSSQGNNSTRVVNRTGQHHSLKIMMHAASS